MILNEELLQAINEVPLLREKDRSEFSIQKLSGLTNNNFRIQYQQFDWVLRIPRANTNSSINREAELYNINIAAELGIAPRYLWANQNGLMLSETVATRCQLTATLLSDTKVLESVIESLTTLHKSKRLFSGRVSPLELIENYFSMMTNPNQKKYRQRLVQANTAMLKIEAADATPVPSHNDLVLDNILLGQNKIWFIDWEYASMASPYWDLATLCNVAKFNLSQSDKLLKIYAKMHTDLDIKLLQEYRTILQLLSDCWMETFNLD